MCIEFSTLVVHGKTFILVTSLEKAKHLLEANQYPPHFYDPIIRSTIEKLIKPEINLSENEDKDEEPVKEKLVFVQYRGNVSDKFRDSLRKMNVKGVTHGPGPMFASKRLKTDPRKMPFKSA